MKIDYFDDTHADFCKHCGHSASLHSLSWDKDQTSHLNVSYCRYSHCTCDRFSLDPISYEQRFPLATKAAQ